jgi:CheY-like chemotaxis protein
VNTKNNLLVEDDEDQVRLALRVLRKYGMVEEVDEVVVARDGSKALDHLFGEGERDGRDTEDMPEFALLDVQLPRRELARRTGVMYDTIKRNAATRSFRDGSDRRGLAIFGVGQTRAYNG